MKKVNLLKISILEKNLYQLNFKVQNFFSGFHINFKFLLTVFILGDI